MTTAIRAIGVVGAGCMGSAIASVCAEAGLPVTLYSRRSRRQVRDQLRSWLARKPQSSDGSRADTLALITVTDSYEPLSIVDLVIECVPEDPATKADVFRALDRVCQPATCFASNTSSLSVSELSRTTSRSDRFAGLHFFNPADRMALVEVVVLPETAPGVSEALCKFVRDLGKVPLIVADSAGFIVNRVLFAAMCEAMRMVTAGVASAEDIDRAMELGANHPIGPLALADLIGLDVCHSVLSNLASALGEAFSPPEALTALISAGRLGRRSGAGFHSYEPLAARPGRRA